MQLIKMDAMCNNIPSGMINKVTMGSKGSSLCGRLYLYNRYMSQNNAVVNTLLWIIDGMESGHCRTAARHWRIRYKKSKCYFPKRYWDYLK